MLMTGEQMEAQKLLRRRKLAETLAQQSLTPAQTEMVSGRAVSNPFGPLAQIAQALAAKKADERIDAQQKAYLEGNKQRLADWVAGMPAEGDRAAQLKWAVAGSDLPGGREYAVELLKTHAGAADKREDRQWQAAEKDKDRQFQASQKDIDRGMRRDELGQQREFAVAKLEQEKAQAAAQMAHWQAQLENQNLDRVTRTALEEKKMAAENAYREADRAQKESHFVAGLEQNKAEAQQRYQTTIAQLQNHSLDREQRAILEKQALEQRDRLATLDRAQKDDQFRATLARQEAESGQKAAQFERTMQHQAMELTQRIKANEAQLQNSALDRGSRENLQREQMALTQRLEVMKRAQDDEQFRAKLSQDAEQARAQMAHQEKELGLRLDIVNRQLEGQNLDRIQRAELQREQMGLQQHIQALQAQQKDEHFAAEMAFKGAEAQRQGQQFQQSLGQNQQQFQAKQAQDQTQFQANLGQRQAEQRQQGEQFSTRLEADVLQNQANNAQRREEMQQRLMEGNMSRDLQREQMAQSGQQFQATLAQRKAEAEATIQRAQAELQQRQQEGTLTREHQAALQSQAQAAQQELESMRQQGQERRQGIDLAYKGAEAGATREFQAGQNDLNRDADIQKQAIALTARAAEAATGREFTAAENDANRSLQAGLHANQQDFQSAQNELQRTQADEHKAVELARQIPEPQPMPGKVDLMELARQAGAAQGQAKRLEKEEERKQRQIEFEQRLDEQRKSREIEREARREDSAIARQERRQDAAIARRETAADRAAARQDAMAAKREEQRMALQTPENAGKIASTNRAIKDIDDAEQILFKNGKLDRSTVAAASVPGTAGLGTEARKLKSAIYNATDVILRLRTGAAANKSEVEKMADTFMPSILDSDESARYKITRLREMFQDAQSITKGANAIPQADKAAPAKPAAGWGIKRVK
jgi:hypothetical protein